MKATQRAFAAKRVYIPKELLAELQDLDPVINANWEMQVNRIFKCLGLAERKYAFSQFLMPKGIRIDSNKKSFVFKGRESFKDVLAKIKYFPLKDIGTKLAETAKAMAETGDALEFADLMENSLAAFDNFDAKENLAIQQQKNQLRAAYLVELVLVTRGAKLKVGENQRKVTAKAFRDFTIEVYLKQQMLGYRFRSLPVASLEQDTNPFVNKVVAREARVRQCDIFRSDTHIYLVSPVKFAGQNPYSIRRFLREEKVLGNEVVYFNAAVIDTDEKLKDKDYQKQVAWILSRMVTLQRQLNEEIVELVESIQKFMKESLFPMLSSELKADGTAVNFAIKQRLDAFQKQLETMVLRRIQNAIHKTATTSDDFEYLFFNLRYLLIDIAGELRDFSLQATGSLSKDIEEMELKALSLLRMVDNRKEEIFVAPDSDRKDVVGESYKLLKEMSKDLQKQDKEIKKLKVELAEVLKYLDKPRNFLQETVKRVSEFIKEPPDPEKFRNAIVQAKRVCLVSIIRVLKHYPRVRIYLEFEEVIPVIEGFRHYAISQGQDGIDQLPLLLELPEEPEMFDVTEIRNLLIANSQRAHMGLSDDERM